MGRAERTGGRGVTSMIDAARRFHPSPRLRTVALAALFGFSSFAVQATPTEVPLPIERPEALKPAPVAALGCADEPEFVGHITSSSGSTAVLTESTTGNVFGYISDVEDDWSCTAYYRYDGLAWTRADLEGVFNWGAIINSTSVPCNWVIGETTYLKANDTTDCADTDAEYAMPIALVANSNQVLLDGVYSPDWSPDELGDWMFIHSDCTSYYEGTGLSGERVRYQVPFGASEVTNRPGDNCDPTVVDISGTAQTLYVDDNPPSIVFDWPTAGGPALVTSAFAGVKFDATDAVRGFEGADDWDLQRQTATWNGSSCGTFANDTTSGNLTSGTTNAADQVVSQGLLDSTCYRWTLAARDANGNSATTITSGSIRTNVTGNLGQQDQHTFESWDLGAGDSLAVNVGTGNLVISHPIVELPIQGASVSLNATYNSHDTTNVGMGPGWRLDAFRRLTVNGDNTVTFTDGDGSRHTFTAPTGSPIVSYTRPPTLYATLTRDTGATPDRFTLTYRDQSKDLFDELIAGTGFLVREQDRHGNGVALGYVGSELRTMTDTAPNPDRVIDLTWTSGKLTKIEDWAWIDGAGVVQTSATGTRRATRFFHDASNKLIGWADPLNTSGTCATQAPHLTCLTYVASNLVATIAKSQTVEAISGGALTGASPVTITTAITYANLDVSVVKDAAEQAAGTTGTVLSHAGVGQTKVVRQGTPASETVYSLASTSDSHARVTSVKRLLAPSTWVEQTTTYDSSYPIEPATVTSNATATGSAPARTVTTTYIPSSMGLVAKFVEPLTATDDRWTEYVYNANNDVTQTTVSLEGTNATVTRNCYHATTCNTTDADLLLRRVIEGYVDGTKGGTNGDDEDVTTEYQYDAYGQKTRETRHNYDGSTLLDSRALGWTYDANGNVTASIENYSDGAVTSPGDDITPNATSNARTDLTTALTYDTAGNQVSSADPRRAIALATAGATYALDNFNRSVTDGWGTAGTGGAWSGTSAEFDVSGAVGTIALASANNKNGYLTSVNAADQELLVRVNVNQLAAGGDTFTWFYLRRQDSSNFYELRVVLEPDQELRLAFRKTVAGSTSSIGSATLSGEPHTTGNWYWVRARLIGSTSVNLKARLWRDGSTEPPTWALDATDAAPPTALQGTGHLGIRFQATGTGSYPVTASYDDLSLTSVGGTSGVGADDFVTRSLFNALNQKTKEVTPTTPGLVISQKQLTSIYDELGSVRETQGFNDVVMGTAYDKAGRGIKTYEDEDGVGAEAPEQESETSYDASGRKIAAKDRRQVADSGLGYSLFDYDSMGRTASQTDAYGTSTDSETEFTYDGLDRQLTVTTGVEDTSTAQRTTYTYDLAGRTLTTDDEFMCATSTYDHRDLVLTVIEGRAAGTCTGTGLRTTTNSYDKLGRQWKSAVTAGQGNGDASMDDRLDAAGNRVHTSATQASITTATTYTINLLDQPWIEARSDGSTAKTNFDAADNATDRCFWRSGTAGNCYSVGTSPWTNSPSQATTTVYDARNNRIGLTDSATSATTTYDPAHDYAVDAVYTPTAFGTGREHQALYDYDDHDRLTLVTHQLCLVSSGHACSSTTPMGSTAVEYDHNDNRTRVTESTSAASLDRYFCYDALDRVLSTRSASGCATGLIEAYAYDDSGNRLTAGSITYAYDGESQLTSCSPSCGTVAYDAAGRTSKWNGWAFEYDAEGRMTRACQSTTDCSSLNNEVEFVYDGDGHRIRIVTYNSGSSTAVATRELRYQGDAIVEEKLTDATHAGVVVRSYVVDEAGAAVKMTIAGSESNPGDYLITWNGHGDALGLWSINAANGALTLANSFTYTPWGAPTVGTHNGYPDLGFRFLYVGRFDVQWDDVHGLGLYYMRARHYSPSLGRFLQPDFSRLEEHMFLYAGNAPVTKVDPDGKHFRKSEFTGGGGSASLVRSFVESVVRPKGRWVGQPGRNPNTRVVDNPFELRRLMINIRKAIPSNVPYTILRGPGRTTYLFRGGGTISYRTTSKSTGPVIQITRLDGLTKKIHLK